MTRRPALVLSASVAARNPRLAATPAPKRQAPRTGPLDAAAGAVHHRRSTAEATTARRGGAAARTSGASLEAWLAAAHDAMRAEGVADVAKVGPPTEPTRIGRRILYRATGAAPPDYLGTLAGGRAVAVEAKRRAGRLRRDRWRVVDGRRVEDRDGIEDHQREALAAWERLGAVALVVVEFRRAKATTRHAVPWAALEAAWVERDGVRSVGPHELAAWVVDGRAYLARWVEGSDGR